MKSSAFIYSDAGLEHLTGHGHPECPERLLAIKNAFDAAKLNPPRIDPTRATRDDVLRIHSEDHYELMHRVCKTGAHYDDPDTRMMDKTWEAALLAAGGAIAAAKAVADGAYRNVFSAMRPPGHHAEHNYAMGFCLFNNVAIAAKWLQACRGVDKVAILDWDVHHGNGTQHSFYDDPSVLYVSLHQFPHYPGTGRPEERGIEDTNLNLCMPPGAAASHWMDAFESAAVPAIERFQPEFLFISCGFDAHRADPLASQNLETEHYVQMTERVKALAGGRVVSLLEGGYNLQALGESAVAHFQALQA